MGMYKWEAMRCNKNLLGGSVIPIGWNEGRGVSEPESFGSEKLAVARSAVNLLVGSIAGQHRVERSMALGAVEAFLVPHSPLGKLLFGGEYHATATRATLTGWRLDCRRIGIVEWSTSRNLFLPENNFLYQKSIRKFSNETLASPNN